MLRATLQALPQLHDLALRLSEKPNTSSQKRPRDAEVPPHHCLANILSAATGLTSLYIRVYQSNSSGHQCCFTAAAPLCLPKLVQLAVIFDSDVQCSWSFGPEKSFCVDVELAARFFSSLTAPLTRLTLSEEGPHCPQPIRSAAAAGAGRLLRSIAAFTQLRCLGAVLPADKHGRSNVCDALVPALPGLVAALHEPQSISLSATPALMQCIMPLLTTTTLTKLHLCGMHSNPATDEFIQRVGRWKLRDLSLHFHGESTGASSLAALSSLTQLTALCLTRWGCLRRPADWQALAAMTGLKRLRLGGEDEFDTLTVPEECIVSLHALSALTSLTVVTPEKDAPHRGEAVVRCLTTQTLPALQDLKVALYEPFEYLDELASYITKLPALRRLTVDLHRSADVEDAPSWVDIDSEDHPENIAMAELGDAQECLSEAAARAGVELEMEQHGFY